MGGKSSAPAHSPFRCEAPTIAGADAWRLAFADDLYALWPMHASLPRELCALIAAYSSPGLSSILACTEWSIARGLNAIPKKVDQTMNRRQRRAYWMSDTLTFEFEWNREPYRPGDWKPTPPPVAATRRVNAEESKYATEKEVQMSRGEFLLKVAREVDQRFYCLDINKSLDDLAPIMTVCSECVCPVHPCAVDANGCHGMSAHDAVMWTLAYEATVAGAADAAFVFADRRAATEFVRADCGACSMRELTILHRRRTIPPSRVFGPRHKRSERHYWLVPTPAQLPPPPPSDGSVTPLPPLSLTPPPLHLLFTVVHT